MPYSEYARSLMQQFKNVCRMEPFDESLAMDLLDALKKESPKAFDYFVKKSGLPEVLDRLFPISK